MSDFKYRSNALVLKLSKGANIPDDVLESLGSVLTCSGARVEFEEDCCKFYLQNFAIIRKTLAKYAEYFWASDSGTYWISDIFFCEKSKSWASEVSPDSEKTNLEYYGLGMKDLNKWNAKYMVPMSKSFMLNSLDYETENESIYVWDKKDARIGYNYMVDEAYLDGLGVKANLITWMTNHGFENTTGTIAELKERVKNRLKPLGRWKKEEI